MSSDLCGDLGKYWFECKNYCSVSWSYSSRNVITQITSRYDQY